MLCSVQISHQPRPTRNCHRHPDETWQCHGIPAKLNVTKSSITMQTSSPAAEKWTFPKTHSFCTPQGISVPDRSFLVKAGYNKKYVDLVCHRRMSGEKLLRNDPCNPFIPEVAVKTGGGCWLNQSLFIQNILWIPSLSVQWQCNKIRATVAFEFCSTELNSAPAEDEWTEWMRWVCYICHCCWWWLENGRSFSIWVTLMMMTLCWIARVDRKKPRCINLIKWMSRARGNDLLHHFFGIVSRETALVWSGRRCRDSWRRECVRAT